MLQSDQEVPTTQYSMTVNENNVINNVNVSSTSLELSEPAKENKTLTLKVFDANGANPITYTVTLTKNSKEVKLGSVTTPHSQYGISSINDVLDGTLSFELYDKDTNGKDVLVGKQSVVKNVEKPELVQVSALRNVTNTATFKGTRFGESDIKTIYYCAVPMTESSAPVWNSTGENAKTFNKVGSFTPTTKKIDMTGKDSFEETITGLERETAYKIYYVLENKYGSLSQPTTAAPSTVVSLSKAVTLEKASKIDETQFKFDKSAKKFTWKDADPSYDNYIITLYKDGKILNEEVKHFADASSHEYILPSELEAGTYYIEVVTVGSITGATTDKLNSDVVKSKTVTVKDVAKVSNVKLDTNLTNGYPELSWTENDANCGGYIVNLYRQDNKTGVYSKQASRSYTSKANNVKKSIYFNTETNKGDTAWNNTDDGHRLDRNYEYLAEVVATPKSDIKSDEYTIYVNSQPTTYMMYVPYREATVGNTTSESVTLTLNLNNANTQNFPHYSNKYGYNKNAEDYTYEVRVYEGTTDMGTKPVTVTYDHDNEKDPEEITGTHFTVDGLKANTVYSFRLIAKCAGFEGWSEEIKDIRTMPRISGLKRIEDSTQCTVGTNTFSIDTHNNLVIDGTIYDGNKFGNKGEVSRDTFESLHDFLKNLEEGDTVTIKDNTVDLILSGTESSKPIALNSEYLTDKVVNLDGTGNERVVTASGLAELHLKNGQFDIAKVDLSSEDKKDGLIVLEDGVVVITSKTASDLTVVPGTVTINNVKMTTQLQTVVRTEQATTEKLNDTQVLVVVANGEKTNNLTFESIYDNAISEHNKNATIKFVSADENAAKQQGTITIKGEGGIVKVAQENVAVGSNITVTVEKGEVDVSESTLTGAKTVTLSGNEEKSITAIAANDVPEVLHGQKIEIKNYTDATALKKALGDNVSAGYEITSAVVTEVNNWLATFGISDKNATVEVDTASAKVTITYSGSETLTVQGLK